MNRLLLTGIVVLMWMITGCSHKDQPPGGILSTEKMEAVLWDMIQAERFTATFVAKDTAKDIKLENFKLYNQVFSIHDITKEEFIKSYKFYLSRPDIARVMFDSLSSRANRLREDLYKSQQPAVADSTKPGQPVKKTDSLQTRFRDSLISNAKRRRQGVPGVQPRLIAPDTVKSTQPKQLAPGAGKATQPTLVPPGTGKSTQPKQPIRPERLRIRDSMLRRP